MHLGQTASIRVDGAKGRVFNGHVGQIASEAEFLPRNVQTLNDREHQVFGTKVFIDNPGGVLKSGMSATVRPSAARRAPYLICSAAILF